MDVDPGLQGRGWLLLQVHGIIKERNLTKQLGLILKRKKKGKKEKPPNAIGVTATFLYHSCNAMVRIKCSDSWKLPR